MPIAHIAPAVVAVFVEAIDAGKLTAAEVGVRQTLQSLIGFWVCVSEHEKAKPPRGEQFTHPLCSWHQRDRVGLDHLHTCVSNSLTQGQTRGGSNRSPDRPRKKGWAKLIFSNISSYLVIKN